MSKKLFGTLAGIGASLAGIILWVILWYVGFIAGIAGALMGLLFVLVYQKINKDDTSKYPVIIACVIIPFEIIFAELLALAIGAGVYAVSFGELLADSEIQMWIVIDVVIGLILSYAVFAGYMFSAKRKNQLSQKRQNAGLNTVKTDTQSDPFNPYVSASTGAEAASFQQPFAEQNRAEQLAESAAVCKICGAPLEAGDVFCQSCGSKKEA